MPATAIATDTFQQPILLNPAGGSSDQITYNMTDDGIAWPGEADKYRPTTYSPDQIVPPPYWRARYPDGYTQDNIPDLTKDQHFQVWMRTAGLPTFRKLYFRNDNENMAAGTYEIDVFMSAFSSGFFPRASTHLHTEQASRFHARTDYPVEPFGGTKSIVISTVSFIGGRNPFLGIAYIAVGGVCVLLGLALTLRHLIKPRKLGDPQVRAKFISSSLFSSSSADSDAFPSSFSRSICRGTGLRRTETSYTCGSSCCFRLPLAVLARPLFSFYFSPLRVRPCKSRSVLLDPHSVYE